MSMKHWLLQGMYVLSSCIFTASAAVPGAGAVLFSDDFNTKEVFAENWEIKGKTYHKENSAYIPSGGSLVMRAKLPDDFYLTAKITLEKKANPDPKKYGMAFLQFGNFDCLLRTDGMVCAIYPNPSGKGLMGTSVRIPDFQMGKSYEVTVIGRRLEKSDLYTAFLNGKQIASVNVPLRKKDVKFHFSAAGCDFSVDDFRLCRPAGENASPNLIVNSSFEHLQEGYPLFFNTDTPRSYTFNGPYEKYISTLSIDTKEKVSGKNSLKLVFDKELCTRQGCFTSSTGVVVGQPVTFSVWLKADRDNLPVTLTIWEVYAKWDRKKILLTKDWKRYELTVPSASLPLFRCGIIFNEPGIVWMDDLQLELADKPSPYKVSDLDEVKFSNDSVPALPAVPPVIVKKLKQSPVMDGNIDSWIPDAAKFGPFYVKANRPVNLTEAYAACDDKNLYIAVRARVKDLAKVKTEKVSHDDFKIFGHENIEVLVDPGKSNQLYCQLVTNASGSQTDMGKGRNKNWNGAWSAVAKPNPAKKSIDYEIRIPFSDLAGSSIAGDWGINLGRNDTTTGELSSIIPFHGDPDFHKVRNFPVLRLPSDVLKKYAFEAENSEFRRADKNTQLGCVLRNLSGDSKKVVVSALWNGKEIASKSLTLKTGDNACLLPLNAAIPDSAEIQYVLRGEKNEPLFSQTLFTRTVSPIAATTRYSLYTPADKAANFRISASLPDPEKYTYEITCGNAKAAGKAGALFEAALPLKDVTEGIHEAKIRLVSPDARTVASTVVLLKKLNLPEGAARINNFAGCLELNRKNTLFFLPLLGTSGGPYHPGVYARMADRLADSGFKHCMFVFSRKHGFEKVVEFCKEAKARGLAVIAWNDDWYKTDDEALVQKEVKTLSDIGSVAAFMVLDEPELRYKSEEARQYMLRMMKRIPNYPVFMNNTMLGIPNRYADYTSDILILDNYLTNQEGKTVIQEVMPCMDALVKASRASRNQPCWFFLVGNNTHNHYREPTGAEQVAQTWGSIVSGATGLAYFLGMPNWPGNWKAYLELNREILALNDPLMSEEKTKDATVSDKTLRFMTRKYNGFLYVFTVNTDPAPVATVSFTLPAEFKYADMAEVEFENRKINVMDGRFTDSFPGYSRHIYKIRIK